MENSNKKKRVLKNTFDLLEDLLGMIFRCFAATGHLFCFPFGTDNKHTPHFLETILVYFQTSTGIIQKQT